MSVLSRHQLRTVLDLQAAMNAKVNPAWQTAGYPFLRAAVVEGAEAIEHHGWKWWKAQGMDLAQFQIELVDILHFALSHMIIETGSIEQAITVIEGQMESGYLRHGVTFDSHYYDFAQMDTLAKMELLIGLATSRRFYFPVLTAIMNDVSMSWDEMVRQYIGKNVLNVFRQDHGYKGGSYIKMWPGMTPGSDKVEDNVYLAEMMKDTIDPVVLYERLKRVYNKVVSLELSDSVPG